MYNSKFKDKIIILSKVKYRRYYLIDKFMAVVGKEVFMFY